MCTPSSLTFLRSYTGYKDQTHQPITTIIVLFNGLHVVQIHPSTIFILYLESETVSN